MEPAGADEDVLPMETAADPCEGPDLRTVWPGCDCAIGAAMAPPLDHVLAFLALPVGGRLRSRHSAVFCDGAECSNALRRWALYVPLLEVVVSVLSCSLFAGCGLRPCFRNDPKESYWDDQTVDFLLAGASGLAWVTEVRRPVAEFRGRNTNTSKKVCVRQLSVVVWMCLRGPPLANNQAVFAHSLAHLALAGAPPFLDVALTSRGLPGSARCRVRSTEPNSCKQKQQKQNNK